MRRNEPIGRSSARIAGLPSRLPPLYSPRMPAQSIGVSLLGCGTVGGGVASILLKQRDMLTRRTGLDLVLKRVDALLGIVNGTCNFILSQMTQKGWSYDQALKEAQVQGFAEANPTMDVTGKDSAQKLAILAGLGFNVRIDDKDIHLEGIDKL